MTHPQPDALSGLQPPEVRSTPGQNEHAEHRGRGAAGAPVRPPSFGYRRRNVAHKITAGWLLIPEEGAELSIGKELLNDLWQRRAHNSL